MTYSEINLFVHQTQPPGASNLLALDVATIPLLIFRASALGIVQSLAGSDRIPR